MGLNFQMAYYLPGRLYTAGGIDRRLLPLPEVLCHKAYRILRSKRYVRGFEGGSEG